jgi:hypothetical protein
VTLLLPKRVERSRQAHLGFASEDAYRLPTLFALIYVLGHAWEWWYMAMDRSNPLGRYTTDRRPKSLIQNELSRLEQAQGEATHRWHELIMKIAPTPEQKSEARELSRYLPMLARQIVARRNELYER